jgi:hypothetical protein
MLLRRRSNHNVFQKLLANSIGMAEAFPVVFASHPDLREFIPWGCDGEISRATSQTLLS